LGNPLKAAKRRVGEGSTTIPLGVERKCAQKNRHYIKLNRSDLYAIIFL